MPKLEPIDMDKIKRDVRAEAEWACEKIKRYAEQTIAEMETALTATRFLSGTSAPQLLDEAETVFVADFDVTGRGPQSQKGHVALTWFQGMVAIGLGEAPMPEGPRRVLVFILKR